MSDPIETEPPPKRLGRTVVGLGFVSLFTDIASEMAYPQIPLFLTRVLGAPPWVVGLIEGIAESAASLLKVVSGWFSDRMGRRKPWMLFGYGVSAISKPLMALALAWPAVLLFRFLDRLGKGLRTAPRDALIAETTPPELRGRAFGLHRTLDTTGAVLGPLLGAWFLSHVSGDARHLFLFAALPGLLAVLILVSAVQEAGKSVQVSRSSGTQETTHTPFPTPLPHKSAAREDREEKATVSEPESQNTRTPERLNTQRLPGWRRLNPAYRRFLLAVAVFGIGNSSDTFLILRASDAGFSGQEVLLLYAAFNVIEALFGYAAGRLSDQVGRRPLIIAGYLVFALVYLGFALGPSRMAIWGLFLLYGGYYALTQGAQRAFAADLADPQQRATHVGTYHTVVGVAALPASLIAGRLYGWNPAAPFAFGSATALLSVTVLLTLARKT